MKTLSIVAALAAALVVGGTTNAPAAAKLYDFTASPFLSGPPYTGTVDGVGFTLTFTPSDGTLTFNDGEAPGAIDGALIDLAGDGDGLGINNDEVTNGGSGESILLTFDKKVHVTALAFLDLFLKSAEDANPEAAIVSVDGNAPVSFIGQSVVGTAPDYGTGFAEYATAFSGTSFLFTAGTGNDTYGKGDYALAALEVQAVPLPASILLLGGALGGLGMVRRRR